MKSNYFPEEVISEIFSKLPVKSILRFICVCKLWYSSLFKNPDFIATHLQKTTISSSKNRYFLCNFWDTRCYLNRCYSLFHNNEEFKEYMPLQAPTFPAFRIVGSCNGLICLLSRGPDYSNYRVFLWNPLIRKSLSLPQPNSVLKLSTYFSSQYFIGFGFDSRSKDYKVLRILCPRELPEHHFRAELYSLNSNSWKDITQNALNYKYFVYEYLDSVFFSGALHWIARSGIKENEPSRNLMMVFKMSDEVFHEITLPQCLESEAHSLDIKVYGESSIAIIDGHMDYETDIWVMKVSWWVKLAKLHKLSRGELRVLGFRNDREALVVYDGGRLASVDLNNHRRVRFIKKFSKECSPRLLNYVESMTLFDKGSDEVVQLV